MALKQGMAGAFKLQLTEEQLDVFTKQARLLNAGREAGAPLQSPNSIVLRYALEAMKTIGEAEAKVAQANIEVKNAALAEAQAVALATKEQTTAQKAAQKEAEKAAKAQALADLATKKAAEAKALAAKVIVPSELIESEDAEEVEPMAEDLTNLLASVEAVATYADGSPVGDNDLLEEIAS